MFRFRRRGPFSREEIFGELCRTCAQSVGRGVQDELMMRAAMVVVLGPILTNARELRRAAKMGRPAGRTTAGLDPSPPLRQRRGVWALAVVIAALLAVVTLLIAAIIVRGSSTASAPSTAPHGSVALISRSVSPGGVRSRVG